MADCSSAEPFRQISTSPATVPTCGQAQLANQLSLNTPPTSRNRVSSVPRPSASAIPRASVRALLAMLRSAPAAGISSQAAVYPATPNPVVASAISTNTIRTAVGLKPRHAATPDATPPSRRSSGLRRSGPPVPPRRLIQNGPRCQCCIDAGSKPGDQRGGCSTYPSWRAIPELAIRAIPDPSRIPGPPDRGEAGDHPDVLAGPAEPLLSHEH